MNASNAIAEQPAFEIRFDCLFGAGRALVFPCDAKGHVDLDALSPRALYNYLFARAMVGRDFSPPRIRHLSLAG